MRAWDEFLALQERELGVDTVNKWLRTLKVAHYDAGNLYLEAKDSFQALWFEEHIRPRVHKHLLNNNRRHIKVHLSTGKQGEAKPRQQKARRGKKQERKEVEELPENVVYTFDELDPICTLQNFVPSQKNMLAYKLLCELTGYDPVSGTLGTPQMALNTFNPIFLYGNNGSGKSHLLMATADLLRQQGLNVIYTRSQTFIDYVIGAIRSGEMQRFREACRNVDVLLIDGIQAFSRKGATQEELFHTFNTLHVQGKQILLSGNVFPRDLQYIEPRLISRFEWGITVPVDLLEKEKLPKLIDVKSRALQFPLDRNVVTFLLETFPHNPKALCRALEALVLRTHMGGASAEPLPLALSSAKGILSDIIEEEQQAVLTPQKVVEIVANHYGIPVAEILGKSQSRECALPRQVAMYSCRSLLKMPYMKIGEYFSRNHSTVMSSVRQIEKRLSKKESELVHAFSLLRKQMLNHG